MKKDNNKYTFLLSHSSKTKIYIRRVEVSKNFLHSGAASLILILGLTAFGFISFIQSNYIETAYADSDIPTQATLSTLKTNSPTENQSINYARPESSDIYSINSGGPLSKYQLTTESEAEESKMEKQLRIIEATSNPAFLPTMWAHLGKINNEYGFRRNPFGGRSYEFHAGMDIDGDRGDIIVAPANGIIVKAGWQGGYGRLIEIDHGNGLTTRYGHLARLEVEVGDTVTRGQLIGLVGSTGRSTGPHLHYELRLNEKSINPRRFLPPEPARING